LQTFFSGCHDLGVILDGVWIGDWLYWPLVLIDTTRNYKQYNATANLHTS
jgi:hypothetical protein